MLTTDEINARLKKLIAAKRIRKKDITAALGLSSESRAKEILERRRKLSHDEAVILCERFGLERGEDAVSPLSGLGARLIARTVAAHLDLQMEANDARLVEIGRSIEALAVTLADPRFARTAEAAEAAFLAIQAKVGTSRQAKPAP